MQQLLDDYTATHLFAAAVGTALLVFGRRLYWLALGGLGFFVGIWLAHELIDLESAGLQLGIGFLVGIVCAYLTTAAQRLAVALGGFFIGGMMSYWAAAWLTHASGGSPGAWLWLLGLFGGMFGTVFASLLFEASLVALTALLGALLLTKASLVSPPLDALLFMILMLIGVASQAGGKKRRERQVAT